MSEFEGRHIRAYELGEVVGSGGFGTVYHAYQDVINREVAVKVIRDKYANQPHFIRRFETEARIIARLEHPHIVPLYDYWRDLDGAYLIMRWLQGGSLRNRMKRERFAPETIVKFLNQIASALNLAHSREIIHRDIKPENILLDDQDNAYLTDFGIAVDRLGTGDEHTVSEENMSYGSPEYVAPEQLIEKKVSPQSDVYSLGIMLYEMLANARPFSGASTQEIVKMQVRNPVPSLKLSRPDLPPEIDTIIWQATAKKPSARYENVMELALAFQEVAGDIKNVPAQYRIVDRRKKLSTGEGDLRTGQMKKEAFGTGYLGTDELATDQVKADETNDIAANNINLATANLADAEIDFYETADLSGSQVTMRRNDTSDLSSVDVSAARYDTPDLSHINMTTDSLPPTSEMVASLGTMELVGEKRANPYKGLSAFQESDAANFYGREALVENLIEHFRDPEKRFLALIGSSGSGKSSLVRAGLIPALRKGRLDGSEDWYIKTMIPSRDPFEALSEILLSVAVTVPKNWEEQLRNQVDGLHLLLASIMPEADAELVLFIDQFEEVFTLAESEEMPQQFLNSLYYALVSPESRLRIIVTLRADYYDRPLNYPEFGELVRENNETVLPLSERDLEVAIRQPIENNYGLIADNLVSAILEEVRHQPGAMPLVQYALTQMYDLVDDNALTYGLYEEIGGVSGALAQSASKIYNALPENQQSIVQQLFMRMMVLGEDGRATRRRILWSDLVSGIEDRKGADAVINKFASNRLLTLDNDPVTRAPTVDIAHEALIEKWDRFQDWIDQNRADLQRRQQLSRAVDEWLINERKSDYLALGSRLAEFESLLSTNTLVLSADEREYLVASVALHQQIAQREQFVKNALTTFAVVSSILAVVAVIAFFIAQFERQRAITNAELARAAEASANDNARTAESRALAAITIANLEDKDLALLIAVEAVGVEASYEARSSLLTAIQTPFLTSYLYGHDDDVRSVAYSPDGLIIASGSADNTIRLWDAISYEPIDEPLMGHTLPITKVAFSPDGTLLASASEDGTVRIWSVSTSEEIAVLEHDSSVRALDFSPDTRFLVTGSGDADATDGQVIVWNMATAEVVFTIDNAHAGITYDVVYNPDGTLIASGGDDNLVRLWDAATGDRVVVREDGETDDKVGELVRHSNWVLTLAFTPDGETLISSGVDGLLVYWDVATQTYLGFIPTLHTGWVRDIAISPDGQILLSASHDGIVKVWTITGVPVGTLEGHTDKIESVEFQPSTMQVLTGSGDGQVGIWEIELPQNPGMVETSTGLKIEHLSVSNNRQRYMIFDAEGTLLVLESASNQVIFNRSQELTGLSAATLSPHGQWLATSGTDGHIIIFDIGSGERLARLEGHEHLISTLLFTPDNTQLISGDESGVIFRWDMTTFEAIETQLERPDSDGITSMVISHNGRYLAIGARDSRIIVWDLTTEEVVATLLGHEIAIDTLVFDQTDTRLISGGRDNVIIVWDFLADDPLQRRLTGHESFIFDLAISPNNQYLASASQDKTVRLWDLETNRPVGLPLTGNQQSVKGVYFRDDETLLSTGIDGNIIRWDLNVDHWVDIACAMSNRNLTPLEWGQYIQMGDYRATCE